MLAGSMLSADSMGTSIAAIVAARRPGAPFSKINGSTLMLISPYADPPLRSLCRLHCVPLRHTLPSPLHCVPLRHTLPTPLHCVPLRHTLPTPLHCVPLRHTLPSPLVAMLVLAMCDAPPNPLRYRRVPVASTHLRC